MKLIFVVDPLDEKTAMDAVAKVGVSRKDAERATTENDTMVSDPEEASLEPEQP